MPPYAGAHVAKLWRVGVVVGSAAVVVKCLFLLHHPEFPHIPHET
jgi:hypothetical protein